MNEKVAKIVRKGEYYELNIEERYLELEGLHSEAEYEQDQAHAELEDAMHWHNVLSRIDELTAKIEESQGRIYELEAESNNRFVNVESEAQELSENIEQYTREKEQLIAEKKEFETKTGTELTLEDVEKNIAVCQSAYNESETQIQEYKNEMQELAVLSEKWAEQASVIEKMSIRHIFKTGNTLSGFEISKSCFPLSELMGLEEIKANEDIYNKLKTFQDKIPGGEHLLVDIDMVNNKEGESICRSIGGGIKDISAYVNFETGHISYDEWSTRPDWCVKWEKDDSSIIDSRLTDARIQHGIEETQEVITDRTEEAVKAVVDAVAKEQEQQQQETEGQAQGDE